MGTFWNTQPVDRGAPEGIIDNSKRAKNIPVFLPTGFSWSKICDISKIVAFLEEFYVEDITSSYRLSYPPEFFEFLFASPSHREEYSLGLFFENRLIGYVLAREHLMSLRAQSYRIVSVNFLCLAKEYRNKNFAPLMIKEITRIANINGIFQAIFTAEKDYGFSILKASYFHYPMNKEVLLKTGIVDSPDEVRDIPQCRDDTKLATEYSEIKNIYNKMSQKFTIFEKFDDESFVQVFRGEKNVLQTVYNEKAGEFASFYIVYTKCLSSNILLKRAYLYYWYGSIEIITDSVSIAHSLGADMFDVLDIANNHQLIKKLKLAEGTGSLKYHVFNIKEEPIQNEKLNFILF
ncbi:uncharacterized protein VICG_00025 [Vittaforma corneae ATCC 50505]|uniref:Glycylpeptide N-tetradecanoyltransferase n=1 Tax=Vittaforma corneae (strain ATCC 50505) TaxID=993615 RepID=L2GQD5_VITCO|nr:uncharacterized protein VICG_00025 [Vittaforma corneae ATCC 50505]ELA42710.1 hypothetical protein VICG_00025 [Vittaforma corneae ATCC 50505]